MGKRTWTTEQEEYLEILYAKYLPLNEITEQFNIHFGTERKNGAISNKANQLGLTKKYIKPNNPQYKAVYQDYEWYYEYFVEQGLNHEEMANLAGCTKRVIEKWGQEKLCIDTYTRMRNKKLNQQQYDLILGSLLGDGHIDKRDNYPLFIVSHAENQKDYLYYKYNILQNLCEMTPTKYQGQKQYKILDSICDCQDFYRFNTRTYDALRPLRDMSVHEILINLNEYSFAIWMLDDGHCNEDGAWELCIPLPTQNDRDMLVKILQDKFDIVARQKSDNRYFRFYINDSLKITNIIMNNIPHNLDIIQYKILSKEKYKHYKEVV